jgi:hypothetical protein
MSSLEKTKRIIDSVEKDRKRKSIERGRKLILFVNKQS